MPPSAVGRRRRWQSSGGRHDLLADFVNEIGPKRTFPSPQQSGYANIIQQPAKTKGKMR